MIFPESAESAALATEYGYDQWLLSRFLKYVPNPRDFIEKMERPPTQYIRVNTLKTSRDELEIRMQSKGFEMQKTSVPEVFAISKAPISLGATVQKNGSGGNHGDQP